MQTMAPYKIIVLILVSVFAFTLFNYLNDPWTYTTVNSPDTIPPEHMSWIPLLDEDLVGFQKFHLKTRNNKSRFVLDLKFKSKESWDRLLLKLREATDNEMYVDCRSWAKEFCSQQSLSGPFLLMVTIPANATQEKRSFWFFEKDSLKMWGTNQKNLLPQSPENVGAN